MRGGRALALGVAGDADGDEQGDAVEHRLDPEGAAELLDAGDADREDGDADERAPDIDAAGLDRGRAEEGADQGRQQIFEADAGLADAQLGGEQHAGDGGERCPRPRRRRSREARTGMPLSAAAFGLAPMA